MTLQFQSNTVFIFFPKMNPLHKPSYFQANLHNHFPNNKLFSIESLLMTSPLLVSLEHSMPHLGKHTLLLDGPLPHRNSF